MSGGFALALLELRKVVQLLKLRVKLRQTELFIVREAIILVEFNGCIGLGLGKLTPELIVGGPGIKFSIDVLLLFLLNGDGVGGLSHKC